MQVWICAAACISSYRSIWRARWLKNWMRWQTARARCCANAPSAAAASAALISELQWQISKADADKGISLTGALAPEARAAMQKNALQQNILTLSKRVNELGVAEPLVQQQGADRIIVELPGVQDTAKAKDIIGRTATLEARLADPDAPRFPNLNDPVPPGDELFTQGRD